MSTMRKTKGSGVMPAVMTFWNADESFNQKETERYIQWVLDCGAHSLSVTGSTGENISMSDDEQKKIIECLVKFVDHQVPVYPGTGKYGTAQTIEMTKFAQKCGAEGALVIMPYYLIPHKRAVVNHFKKLREAVGDDFDIILYNNPRFCGYQFEPIELKELAEQGIINGVKLADGRASYIQGMKHYCPDGITALYGHDYEPLPAFFAGADGWLSGLPGIFPKFCVDLFNLCTVQQDAPAASCGIRCRTSSTTSSPTATTIRTGTRSSSMSSSASASTPVCPVCRWATCCPRRRRRSTLCWPTWTSPSRRPTSLSKSSPFSHPAPESRTPLLRRGGYPLQAMIPDPTIKRIKGAS